MHKIFGEKENVKYRDRDGAYLIPVRDGCIGVVQTPKGYFLLGGGRLDSSESDKACIERECMEETGYMVSVGHKLCSAETYCQTSPGEYFHPVQTYYFGQLLEKVQDPIETDHRFLWIPYEDVKEKMYAQMQAWAIEECWIYLKGIADHGNGK